MIVDPVACALIARYIWSLDSILQYFGDWISENLWALEMYINVPPKVPPHVPALNHTYVNQALYAPLALYS